MPRYFFHVVDGHFTPDQTGVECATPAEVKAHAVEAAGSMLRDQRLALWKSTMYWDMFVTDESDRTLLKLSFCAEDLTGEFE